MNSYLRGALLVGLGIAIITPAVAFAASQPSVPTSHSDSTSGSTRSVSTSETRPEAGESITARLDSVDQTAMTATISGTATFTGPGAWAIINDTQIVDVSGSGSWTATTPALRPGMNTISVELYNNDQFNLVELATAPTLTATVGTGSGFTAYGVRAADGSVRVHGSAPQGATVHVSRALQFTEYGTSQVRPDGTWELGIAAGALGTDSLRVDLGRTEFDVRGVPLSQITSEEPPNDPALSGTVSFSADVTENAVVSGTGVTGSTIDLLVGDAVIAGPLVVRDGAWRTEITAIGAGAHTITIRQTAPDGTVQSTTTVADYGPAVAIIPPAP
ncbi:hypothetical protein [Curtobacterium sp. Leaf261]|uniref:hypothetical protein n=1 Tax=Curtobacterium sp. Leaf261 TaxID=1736311 RepID=UPI0006FFEE04|nr:hypothetical protein [Curtobacterium sp. Leaf261]KQO61367.1 hypothetical protein ASF23_12880 [Curtobacterium sp. Leaf261]